MIGRDAVMPLLLAACPSFAAAWTAYTADGLYEPDLLYVHLGEFSRHLVQLAAQGNTSDFTETFAVVERLHVEGDNYVAEAATIGLLESIQNHCGHDGVDEQVFLPWLLPETRNWWDRLNRFWAGDPHALRHS